MADNEKWDKLLQKLKDLTQEGKLVWEGPETGKLNSGRDFKNFHAQYQDKYFRVRQHSGNFVRKIAGGPDRKTPGDDKCFLAILDSDRNLLFSIPAEVEGVEDLFEAVTFQKAGIDKMLDDLMKE